MGNITKPSLAKKLVMYGKTVRVYTAKETFRLDFIVTLNASGVLKNGVVL